MTTELIVRSATPADVPAIFNLIKALAEYEKLSHAVTGNPENLEQHLFGSKPYAEAIIAEYEEKPVGFALFFHNYSTFLTQPGIYLEDLFVLPEYRRQGIGKALLTHLAKLAVSRDCGRLEWSVLDWNESAIAFYQNMGASILDEWRICRVHGESLTIMANQAPAISQSI
jgi:GNAT superfamily N-acetyltransferase